MNMRRIAGSVALLAMMAVPLSGRAQDSYEARRARARAAQHRHNARHHSNAKVIGGSAAGGAVIGGLAGGGKGALIGGAIGAGGGAIGNKIRNDHETKTRERNDPR